MSSTERRGLAVVISAPSGTGKTTVCREVAQRDSRVSFAVSHTTRPQRPQERDGVDYHFVDEPEFRRLIEGDAFLEYAEYNGSLYGTTWQAVEGPLAAGRDVLLEIDIQGARQVRERRPASKLIFLLPPSWEALEARLRSRGTDSSRTIEQRLAIAGRELGAARWFDHIVINDRLGEAVESVVTILHAAREGKEGTVSEQFGREAARARLDPCLASRIFG